MFALLNSTLLSAFVACIAEAVLPCKVSFIVGSYAAFFSLNHCFTPLMGKYGRATGSFYYYCIRTLIKIFKAQALSSIVVVYHVPTLLGTLYASAKAAADERSGMQKLALKLAMSGASISCIALFLAHATGAAAWAYTLFWFIPASVPFMRTKNFFIEALAATFFAHAVGSVIWLYSNPMTPAVWLGLIPVVALERLFFALGAVALEKFLVKAGSFFQKQAAQSKLAKLITS